MSFIPVMAKLNFQQLLLQSRMSETGIFFSSGFYDEYNIQKYSIYLKWKLFVTLNILL